VCERELGGHRRQARRWPLPPGERGWKKIEDRDYWRYEMERESAINNRRINQFV
jgi:hypothetical protein